MSEEKDEKWYSDRELLEQVQGLRQEMNGLRVELAETRTKIRDYNGLRDDVAEVIRKVVKLEANQAGCKEGAQGVKFDTYKVVNTLIAVSAVIVAIVAILK